MCWLGLNRSLVLVLRLLHIVDEQSLHRTAHHSICNLQRGNNGSAEGRGTKAWRKAESQEVHPWEVGVIIAV